MPDAVLVLPRIHRDRSFALVAWLLVSMALSTVGAAPYFNVTVSNGVRIVTWTNFSELRLLESADGSNWVRSTRLFVDYLQAHYRYRVSRTQPMRFFRLDGNSMNPPRFGFETEFDNIYFTWPYPSAGFSLRFRDRVESGPWTTVAPSDVAAGYKRLTVPTNDAAQYFRLSRPMNHVLIVGQSLSVGAGGAPVLSSNQPFQNKIFIGQKFDSNDPFDPFPVDDLSEIVPMVERGEPVYGRTGETIASGFANTISSRVGAGEHDLLVSNCGRGGADYEALKRGTFPYARGTNQIAAGKTLCNDLGYQFQAIFAVHGEGDGIAPDYDLSIRQWQQDFAQDMRLLTGQATDPPMFHSQLSAWGNLNANFVLSPFLVLKESEQNPTRTVLVGPKYFLPYSDGVHLTAEGYRTLGEYYAKAYHQRVVLEHGWSPLRPVSISRSNELILVTLTGIVGNLVFDTNAVSDPRGSIYVPVRPGPSVGVTVNPETDQIVLGANHAIPVGELVYFHGYAGLPDGMIQDYPYFVITAGSNTLTISTNQGGTAMNFTNSGSNVLLYLPSQMAIGPFGFEYFDDEGSGIPWQCATTVQSVEIVAPSQVAIRLSRTPTGTNKRIRYAYTARMAWQGGWSGPQLGPRGCLRDSDPAPSLYGHPLYNWCVHFDKEVP
jgi:hypothetical protein